MEKFIRITLTRRQAELIAELLDGGLEYLPDVKEKTALYGIGIAIKNQLEALE